MANISKEMDSPTDKDDKRKAIQDNLEEWQRTACWSEDSVE